MARLSPEAWEDIRQRRAAGETMNSLAREYKVTSCAIHRRAVSRNWETPALMLRGKTEKGMRAAAVPGVPFEESYLASQATPRGTNEANCNSLAISSPSIQALATLADADPATFQSALVTWGQALIAAGAAAIEPPRNLAEVKLVNDLIRKAGGMDAKAGTISLAVVAPLRTLGRRSRASGETLTADVVTDPYEV